MFDKLTEAKRKADEIKAKLTAIKVEGTDEKSTVTVTFDGNKNLVDVNINGDLWKDLDLIQQQTAIMIAVRKGLENAENVSSGEMRNMMASMLPGIGGLFGK